MSNEVFEKAYQAFLTEPAGVKEAAEGLWEAAVAQAVKESKFENEMSWGVIEEIRDLLTAQTCLHGEGKHSGESTPPMMFPEWIACVIQAAIAQAKRDALMEAETLANGCFTGKAAAFEIRCLLEAVK